MSVGLADKASDLSDATKLILPGVGAFDHAIELLTRTGMIKHLNRLVLVEKMPVLGVCVGMQLMSEYSEEGTHDGLGWIPGASVRKLSGVESEHALSLPHMGWNDIFKITDSPLLQDIGKSARFYFLHSYYFHVLERETILAETQYGIRFPCVVNRGNIFATQFHPEKSHIWGGRILRNFATFRSNVAP